MINFFTYGLDAVFWFTYVLKILFISLILGVSTEENNNLF